MDTFRTKPAEVQAARWDGTAQSATPIIEWVLGTEATATYICSDAARCAEHNGDAPHWIKVDDPDGQFFVHIGEWLVRGERGKFDRYSHPAFGAKYEQVTPATAPSLSPDGGDPAMTTQDIGTQYAGLTDAERAAASVDPHIPHCDAPTIADCISCSGRVAMIRRVLEAAGPTLRHVGALKGTT